MQGRGLCPDLFLSAQKPVGASTIRPVPLYESPRDALTKLLATQRPSSVAVPPRLRWSGGGLSAVCQQNADEDQA
jgi:hypothetical protein